ncbi:imm11 family protein [Paenibacillus taiwanensis]|uniref:imm11 family protein n=1 Tax=Paenibacillus taiwanensis TaxID=401638 RepID=UPI000423B299|nr:DUF1629 domain-containing protein [Paenibacillus taiwanensis]
MNIWETAFDPNNDCITTSDDNSSPYEHSEMYKGVRIRDNWVPFDVYTYQEGKHRDFINYFGGLPVVSKKTFECLEPHLKEVVEFLPLRHPEEEMYVMNIVNVIDALDYEKTAIRVLPCGSMEYFDNVYFVKDRIKADEYIFKIPETVTSRPFVTDRFIELLDKYNIKGPHLNFRWSYESTCGISDTQIEQYYKVLKKLRTQGNQEKFTFSQALMEIKSNKTYRSGEYKLRIQYGDVRLGTLTNECKIAWRRLHYITPKLEGLLWHEDDTNDFGEFV